MPSNDIFSTYAASRQAEIIARFMDIYKSNPKVYGLGLKEGMTFDDNNNKWKPKISTVTQEAKEKEWKQHLSGERFIGLGPPLDNATAWWACIDIDQIKGVKYEVDYGEEMAKLKQSGLPLVPDRSKNSGFHLKVFFTEPVPCDLIRKVLWKWAAQLGYAGSEIFPKQFSELGPDDFPNWVFMPYGPTWGEFAEQCGMNESGNAISIEEYLAQAEKKKVSLEEFKVYLKDDSATNRAEGAKTNYKSNGLFVTERATVEDTFKGGPPCLMTLAKIKVYSGQQHDFLFECGTFLKKKYPDNWPEAVRWVSVNILVPPGNTEKTEEIISDHKKHSGIHSYEYRCHVQPMESYCYSSACGRLPYGVGNGKNKPDFYELGLSYIDRFPRVWNANIGNKRVPLSSKELMNVGAFREKCVEFGADFPERKKAAEWDLIVRRAIDNATRVDPPEVMKTDAKELLIIEEWLGIHIISGVRRNYGEFMKGDWGDIVRIREDEQRIYFKPKKLLRSVTLSRGIKDEEAVRTYIGNKLREHKPGETGIREWFRYTNSIEFNQFNEETLQKWFNPDKEEEHAQ